MKRYFYEAPYAKRGRNYLTLRRAAPEWCNLDCPDIYVQLDSGDVWPVASGLHIEDCSDDEAALFIQFVEASERAFYKKYPRCYDGRNGYMENLKYYNQRRLREVQP